MLKLNRDPSLFDIQYMSWKYIQIIVKSAFAGSVSVSKTSLQMGLLCFNGFATNSWYTKIILGGEILGPCVFYSCVKICMVTSWKHVLRHWACLRGIHRSPVDSTHNGQWRRAFMFFICAWTNGWANNRDAGDLKRHRAHYDVTIMETEQGPILSDAVLQASDRFPPDAWV